MSGSGAEILSRSSESGIDKAYCKKRSDLLKAHKPTDLNKRERSKELLLTRVWPRETFLI